MATLKEIRNWPDFHSLSLLIEGGNIILIKNPNGTITLMGTDIKPLIKKLKELVGEK